MIPYDFFFEKCDCSDHLEVSDVQFFFHFSDSDLFQLEEELEENEENEMLYDVTEDLNIGRTAEPSQSGYFSK